jgi:peptidoglycan hydrolase CwlO-like protein
MWIKILNFLKIIPIKVWFIFGIIILIILLWNLGTIQNGYKDISKFIFARYTQAIEQFNTDKAKLEAEVKDLKNTTQKLNTKIGLLKNEITESDRRIKNVEEKIKGITIPDNVIDLVSEFNSMGYTSARSKPK